MDRACHTCEFWFQYDPEPKIRKGFGACHRMAPTFQALLGAHMDDGFDPYDGTWPGTDGTAWCGEYRERGGDAGD